MVTLLNGTQVDNILVVVAYSAGMMVWLAIKVHSIQLHAAQGPWARGSGWKKIDLVNYGFIMTFFESQGSGATGQRKRINKTSWTQKLHSHQTMLHINTWVKRDSPLRQNSPPQTANDDDRDEVKEAENSTRDQSRIAYQLYRINWASSEFIRELLSKHVFDTPHGSAWAEVIIYRWYIEYIRSSSGGDTLH